MTTRIREIKEAAARTAERQMRRWTKSLEVRQHVDEERAAAELQKQLYPYVAISRESGIDGSHVAMLVASALKCDMLDQELLNCMAESYNWGEDLLQTADEATRNQISDLADRWLGQRLATPTHEAVRLGHLLLMVSRHKSVVIVGRGGQFLLPREKGVLVRLIAPREQRIRRTAELLGLNAEAAALHIDRTDRERSEFIQQHFHRDLNDPQLYDLVINLRHSDLPIAAELIVAQFRHRFS